MLVPFDQVVRRCKPITGILHVGAHHAEERGTYDQYGVPRTVWVEADPRKADWLAKDVLSPDKNQVISCAATNVDGPVVLRVTSNDGMSSSLLPLKIHSAFYPHIVESEQITVNGRRLGPYLDELGIKIGAPEGLNFLNLDIQGAELLALEGLEGKVGLFDTIYTEVNTAELYAGAVLLPQLDDFLHKFGFVRFETQMWGEGESGGHHQWGDAIYIRM